MDDIRREISGKYGALAAFVVPRPAAEGPHADPPGVGLAFVEFR